MHWFLSRVVIALLVSVPSGYSQPTATASNKAKTPSPAPPAKTPVKSVIASPRPPKSPETIGTASPAPDADSDGNGAATRATAGPVEDSAAAASDEPDLARTACSKEFRDFVATAKLTNATVAPCADQAAVAAARAAGPCLIHHGYKYQVHQSLVWEVTYTSEAWMCCLLCHGTHWCNSWWMKKSNGKCYLNAVQAPPMPHPNACGNNV